MRTGYDLPQRRLVSQQDSSMVEGSRVPRSRFIGSWTRKTAFDAGYLVPFLLDEVLPGDHLSYDVEAYIRLSTPLFPLFDNQRIDTFFFFVPNRLVWVNWVKFMGETSNVPGVQPETVTVPTVISPAGGFAQGSLHDHMGLPVAGQITPGETIQVNALPLRAYNLIWNEWFRDQNVEAKLTVSTGDGVDGTGFAVRRRAKAHDYFTSALPWPQKWTAPSVAIGGLAPIIGLGAITTTANTGPLAVQENQGAASYDFFKNLWDATAINQVAMKMDHAVTGVPQVYADLSEASGVAINTLRQAWMIQSLLERDARGGTRYVELIRSHFDVISPDFRLARPEYIGGGQSPLNITPIAQTAPDSSDNGLGSLGAAGTSAGQHRASYAATEHGYILGLINVRTELSYQQGVHKMWTRSTRYDFYWPSLAGLGEQAILRQELYCTGVDADDQTVFGYQERWHEYRTRTSEVTGIMRSTAAGTLDAWHLAQKFTAPPTLNSTFIQDNPPMDRVLAAGSLAVGQQYLADILIKRNAVRPIPMYGTPAQLGRF